MAEAAAHIEKLNAAYTDNSTKKSKPKISKKNEKLAAKVNLNKK